MRASRRFILRSAVALPLAGLLLAGLLATCLIQVPEGHLGVCGGEPRQVLQPGFHVTFPWRHVDLYPLEAKTIAGRATATTREGARVAVRYTLRARINPENASSLPPRAHDGPAREAFAEELATLVDRIFRTPPVAGEETLASHVRGGLSAAGLTVENLSVSQAAPAPPVAAGALPRAARLKHPIVLIGLDGADWQILDPLIERGVTPNLARLKARSAWGYMRSYEPILSPLLWTTVMTGKGPEQHGIIDFLVADSVTGKRTPISSRSRRVRTLWEIFTQRGLTADVIAWWATWPATPLNGRMVTDRVAYSLFNVDAARTSLTYPPELWKKLRGLVRSADAIGYEQVARFLDITDEEFAAARRLAARDRAGGYKQPINHLTKIIAASETYQRIALELLREGQPELFAVYYQGIDEVCHRFAHFMAPKMDMVSMADFRRYHRAVQEYYIYQDELLGELLSRLDPASTVIVISDHGFRSGSARPTDGPADIEGKPGKWHRLYGIAMIVGEGIPAGRFDTATLYDVAPTILSLAGLPLADDMKGVPLLKRPPGRGSPPPRIATYERPASTPPVAGGPRAPPGAADEDLLRNLASLGYISSTGGSGGPASHEPGDPSSVTAHTNMATVLLRKGDLPGAEAQLRQALDLAPSYFPALMGMARVLVMQKRIGEALEMTRRAIARNQKPEPGAYVQLALLASRAGRTAETGSFLARLRERRPAEAGVEVGLGVLALKAGRPAEAEARLRACLALNPASPEAMGWLFSLYQDDGREVELEDDIRKALAVNDQSILHHNWLGLILERLGDARGAEKQFERALEIAPDFGGTMANLGSLYGRTGRLEKAVTILSRAVRIEPKNLQARVNLGAALAKLGRLDEAIADLEEARRMGLRSIQLLNAVGLAYAQAGRKGQAIEALEESLSLSPDQPQVQALLRDLSPPT
ncbi:MAG: alkaline phosphatase family protein [Acidobacteriota bacterium]